MGRKPKSEQAMTNAERQRAYRARKQKNAPRMTIQQLADAQQISRTLVFYAMYVSKHRPDLASQCEAGNLKVTTAYRLARMATT